VIGLEECWIVEDLLVQWISLGGVNCRFENSNLHHDYEMMKYACMNVQTRSGTFLEILTMLNGYKIDLLLQQRSGDESFFVPWDSSFVYVLQAEKILGG